MKFASCLAALATFCFVSPAAAQALQSPPQQLDAARKAAFAELDPLFETFMREQNVPGLVYGVVADGRLAYVRSLGVQDVETKAPVTPDTVFRIASMSKNFTALAALKLRDEGRLALDDPAERHVPELKGLRYPTSDSPKITVRDLLSHTGGFVTDDPWGDRQLDMPEADFSRFVAAGAPFSRTPGTGFEYSNFGYALAGRVVSNAAGRPYADYIAASFFAPLGMASTTYDIGKVPAARLARGYRWEDGQWKPEPALGPGAFGAMGGLLTSADDYARYMAWELAAWPPRNEPEDSVLARASIREIARPQTYLTVQRRAEPDGCDRGSAYGLGTISYTDCVLGLHFGHSGGLPGYGSNVLMLPQRGLGVFAFTNRTYAPASVVVRQAATQLVRSGAFPLRESPSPAVKAMAETAMRIYAAGDILAAREALAINFLLDEDAAHRNARIAPVKEKLGDCSGELQPVRVDSALSAILRVPCERGTLEVRFLLAPTTPLTFQALDFRS
jgi:Beta-lactamase class C and other penicillin binding proteins